MRPGSLRGRLRWLILIVLAAVLIPLGLLSFQRTIEEVDELSDGRLAQGAHTLAVLIEHAGIDSLRGHDDRRLVVPINARSSSTLIVQGHTYESEVGFQVFDNRGHVSLATGNLADLPPPQPGDRGFRDIRQGRHLWRIYTLDDNPDGIVIRAGERYDSRHEIMHALWLDHGLPLLIGLPLLGLLVGWAVRRGLRPLAALADALSSRQPGSHEPLVLDRPPLELQPVLDALNDQLGRLEDALERERRFSADVAHELRTPLASTLINLESAMATTDSAEIRIGLVSAQHGLARLARRVEQLLALARLESGAASNQRVAVDLVAVAIAVIEELAPVIAESGVDMEFTRVDQPLIVQGYEAALAALLRNLVENALRHVPAGGQVQLSIEAGTAEARLDVIDDGPGIPAERRADVFARFHREAGGDGYGLGLSIVQRAAQLHDASIELLDSPFGKGLRVRVAIPLR
jgi:two-component system sensor histidine kinase QseC